MYDNGYHIVSCRLTKARDPQRRAHPSVSRLPSRPVLIGSPPNPELSSQHRQPLSLSLQFLSPDSTSMASSIINSPANAGATVKSLDCQKFAGLRPSNAAKSLSFSRSSARLSHGVRFSVRASSANNAPNQKLGLTDAECKA